jgi:protein SCO1/2
MVRLGDYFGKRPVILSLAYFHCPMLCTLVLNGLASSLGVVPLDIGKDFTVVTVSIDPRETAELAASKKEIYVKRLGRPGAAENWHFLTGDEASIHDLTRAIGFRYAYDAEIDQYAHAAGIVVATPVGRIARYFYGVEFAPRDLRLGLVEASSNRIGSWTDQILLFCYQYDPASGTYGAIAMGSVRAGGIVTVLGIATFVAVMLRRERAGAKV